MKLKIVDFFVLVLDVLMSGMCVGTNKWLLEKWRILWDIKRDGNVNDIKE